MSSRATKPAGLAGLTALLLALPACQNPHNVAREEATRRWNVARAQVKARLAADQFQAGNTRGAAAELAEATRLDPDNPEHIPLQARILLAEGKLEQAARLLEDADRTAEAPDKVRGEIEYLLGVVYQQQQQWPQARAAFLRAMQLDDEQVDYVVALTQTCLQLGETEAALETLESTGPKFGWTNTYQATLAECHEQLDDWTAAAAAWQRVAASPAADAGIRMRLAVALYEAQRYNEATAALEDLFDKDPGTPASWLRLLLTECYLETGRNAAAREQVQMVLQEEHNNVHALRLLARSLGADRQFTAALRAAQRALAVKPNDVQTLELVAALAWRSGRSSHARFAADRLRELDPGNPVARQVLQESPPQ